MNSRPRVQRSNFFRGPSAYYRPGTPRPWARIAFECVVLSGLVSEAVLFATGSGYEATTRLVRASAAGDAPDTPPAAAAPDPTMVLAAAEQLGLEQASGQFRVSVLRDEQLQLSCWADIASTAQRRCDAIAAESAKRDPNLHVVEPATAAPARGSALAGVGLGLLAGLLWLAVRALRGRGTRERLDQSDSPEQAPEWMRWTPPPPQQMPEAGAGADQGPAPVSWIPPSPRPAPSARPAPARPTSQVPAVAARANRLNNPTLTFNTLMGVPTMTKAEVLAAVPLAAGAMIVEAEHTPLPGAAPQPGFTNARPPFAPSAPQLAMQRVQPFAGHPLPGAFGNRELSTRVLYHANNVSWSADPEVMTSEPMHQLLALCDELRRRRKDKREAFVVRIASDQGSRYAKTLVAAQLAWLLSDFEDTRALLMEADADAPALHTLLKLNVPQGMGFSEQLVRFEHMPMGRIINILRISANLHALLETRWGTPAQLDSEEFVQVLQHQKREHDIIVVDGPVVTSGWPDAETLHDVDGIVFVIAGATRMQDAMQTATRHFEASKVLKLVCTGESTPP